MRRLSYQKPFFMITGLALGLLAAVFASAQFASAAACVPPTTDYGSATITVNIPSTGSYRAWSRLKASSENADHNSYMLEIDGNTCYEVGGGAPAGISQTNWTWVDFFGGNPASKLNHNFSTAGNHTIKLIGREPNVKLDRVIFTQDVGCVPTDTGNNCAEPPDTTPPSVSVSAPSTGATVNGSVNITANASDADSGVQRVEFRVDGTVVGQDTTAPYAFSWNSASVANGSHVITARAYDVAGNSVVSSNTSVTVNNASPADLVITNITYSPANPAAGTNVTFSATIKNQGGTATPGNVIHGVAFRVGSQVVAWSDNTNQSLAPGATRTVTANGGPASGVWAAVLGTHTVTAQVDDVNRITESNENNNTATINLTVASSTPPADTTAPTVSVSSPANNANVSGTINVAATASDNVGVAKVEFYLDNDLVESPDSTLPYAIALDTTSVANGSHTLTAKAYDQAGNVKTSTGVTVTINNATQNFDPSDINQDGAVNMLDFSILAGKFGQTGTNLGRSDINQDGAVNMLDFSILAGKFGK